MALSFGADIEVAGGGRADTDCRLRCKAGSVGALVVSNQKPRETVGDEAPGVIGPLGLEAGMRTSRSALAPQLILLAKGEVGLPLASLSSTALSSAVDVEDEIEETEPRLIANSVCV